MSTRVTRPPVGSLMIVQRLTWFAGFDLACALAHDLIQRRPTGTRTARGGLARRSRGVRSLGDALLPVRGGLRVLAVPGSYLKCRGIRQRRRTGHQVVGVGRVCQDLLVFVAATPLPCPSPSFTGDDGGLLVSMRGPKTPRASMAYTDAESTRATARTGTASPNQVLFPHVAVPWPRGGGHSG